MRLARSILRGSAPVPAPRPAPPVPAPVAPSMPAALVALRDARVAFAARDHATALAHFDRALRLDPKLGLAALGRALCLFALDKPEAAAEGLAEALRDSPETRAAAYSVAGLCAREGDAATAISLLQLLAQSDDSFRAAARGDPAFRTLRDHPLFLQAIGDL